MVPSTPPTRLPRASAASGVIAHLLAPAAFGGLERVVAGLSVAMVERGRTVVVILVLEPGIATPPWADAIAARGVVVETIVAGRRAYAAERRDVLQALIRHNVTVVHIHGERPAVVDGAAALRAGFGVIATMHGFTRGGWRRRLLTWVLVRAMRKFDAVVAVSRPLLEVLHRAGLPMARLVLIPNGFTPPLTAPLAREVARRTLGLKETDRVIGWIGRASHEKGLDIMVDAVAALGTNATCCVIGDGPALGPARERSAAAGVADRMVFALAQPDAARFLAAFDVLALSSRTEGTPMVILEAAAAGVPVVATAVGGVPDLLGGGAGWLVPSENPSALAEALRSALEDPESARQRAAMLTDRLASADPEQDWIVRHLDLYAACATSRGATP
jgi:glycosyltransferase involved in cell wall biosynthesis